MKKAWAGLAGFLCIGVAMGAASSDWPEGGAALARAREILAAPRQNRLDEDLYHAVGRKDIGAVRRILNEGADPNGGEWPQPMSPFQLSILQGRLDLIELLLSRGGSVLPSRDRDVSALALLAQSPLEDGQARDLALRFLSLGAPVQFPTYYDTPLMAAVSSGRLWLVRLLLERGADLNYASRGGNTPLAKAVIYRRKDILRLLLGGGATPGRAGRSGDSPLLLATIYGDVEVAGLLLDHGADPNERWGGGSYAIHSAACPGLRDLDMIRLLVRRGARLDVGDLDGITPLHSASVPSIPSCLPVLRLLIEEGAPVGARDKMGRTPLMFAAMWGHVAGAEALLAAGACKEDRDKLGNTALDHARRHDAAKVYDLLKP